MSDQDERWLQAGAWVVREREARGWTQSRLAHEADLSTTKLRQLERGTPANYRQTTLARIAIALGNPSAITRILEGREPETIPTDESKVSAEDRLAAMEERLAELEKKLAATAEEAALVRAGLVAELQSGASVDELLAAFSGQVDQDEDGPAGRLGSRTEPGGDD